MLHQLEISGKSLGGGTVGKAVWSCVCGKYLPTFSVTQLTRLTKFMDRIVLK